MNDDDYDRALVLIRELWDTQPGSTDWVVFEVMSCLASEYDRVRRNELFRQWEEEAKEKTLIRRLKKRIRALFSSLRWHG